jgi:hypothetical protein
MNDSETDDYGEWLRLAQEALGALSPGQLFVSRPVATRPA